jgi:hypothetical protein
MLYAQPATPALLLRKLGPQGQSALLFVALLRGMSVDISSVSLSLQLDIYPSHLLLEKTMSVDSHLYKTHLFHTPTAPSQVYHTTTAIILDGKQVDENPSAQTSITNMFTIN